MELPEPDALDLLETTTSFESQNGAPQGPESDGVVSLLPIWSRQIETSRQQTEDAIVALTARFAAAAAVLMGCFGLQQLSDDLPKIPGFSIPVSKVYGKQIAKVIFGGIKG